MRYLINTLIVLGCILMSACQEDDIKPDLSYYQDFWVKYEEFYIFMAIKSSKNLVTSENRCSFASQYGNVAP